MTASDSDEVDQVTFPRERAAIDDILNEGLNGEIVIELDVRLGDAVEEGDASSFAESITPRILRPDPYEGLAAFFLRALLPFLASFLPASTALALAAPLRSRVGVPPPRL
jgi:hypothetical protein